VPVRNFKEKQTRTPTKIRRLFRADVHAVLDIIEEPEAILKQAIREMQEALDLKRARLARDQRNLASLKESEAYSTEQLAKIQKDLKLCLKEGSEELSHKTVGRKLANCLCPPQPKTRPSLLPSRFSLAWSGVVLEAIPVACG
jgi:hypothetical protein